MKKFALTLTILSAFVGLAFAGSEPYSGKDKEVMQPAPAPCDWYRANEWNLDIWAGYALASNTGDGTHNHFDEDDAFFFEFGNSHEDRFIHRDTAWSGGGDIKYFFSKYWALGGEGFAVDANDNIGGAGLGTFTFRFPIGCSRFAPYAWVGFGYLGGGSRTKDDVFFSQQLQEEVVEHDTIKNTNGEAIGQFGGGLEIRITRPTSGSKIAVGVMADFSWNAVQDVDNDFGMGRFGLTFSY